MIATDPIANDAADAVYCVYMQVGYIDKGKGNVKYGSRTIKNFNHD